MKFTKRQINKAIELHKTKEYMNNKRLFKKYFELLKYSINDLVAMRNKL